MHSLERPTPMKVPYFTRGTLVVLGVALIGIGSYLYRMVFGLGAATHLDNQWPWGIWIAIDVATGVALAAGGFTTAALGEIFHRDKFHVILRPALLTAMLGYTFVVIGLLADLGRYYNVWHPMLPSMWQGNSVLFEVGMCVMVYLTVLYIEFLPVVVERFQGRVALPGPLGAFNGLIEWFLRISGRTLRRFIFVFVIAGVVLSCLHQSSLGTLMVIAPTKIHPLWYTPLSPLLFLISAISVGFPMVIFESILASRSFKLKPEVDVLASLSRFTPPLLGVYLALKLGDITLREAWPYVAAFDTHSFVWLAEILFGVVTPMLILSNRRLRHTVGGLFTAATLVVLGVAFNRINVFLVAYHPPYAEKTYFPSFFEFAVTIGLIATLVLVYRALVMIFPVIAAPVGGEAAKEVAEARPREAVSV